MALNVITSYRSDAPYSCLGVALSGNQFTRLLAFSAFSPLLSVQCLPWNSTDPIPLASIRSPPPSRLDILPDGSTIDSAEVSLTENTFFANFMNQGNLVLLDTLPQLTLSGLDLRFNGDLAIVLR